MSDQILYQALERLKQPEKFDKYYQYLYDEWLSSPADLLLASQDEHVWAELKLPLRLKIELKAVLEENPPTTETQEYSEEEVNKAWTLYYCDEQQAYYYYNSLSGESQWAATEDYDQPEPYAESYDQSEYPVDSVAEQTDIAVPVEKTPSRVFSRPKVASGASHTFDRSAESEDQAKRTKAKQKRKDTHKSKFKHTKSYSDSDSDSDSALSSSTHSDESVHYIVSEARGGKTRDRERLKVEKYSIPRSQDTHNDKFSHNFENLLLTHDTAKERERRDMSVPYSSSPHHRVPSAPVAADESSSQYEQSLRAYRQDTKRMSGNDVSAATPMRADHAQRSRRAVYEESENYADPISPFSVNLAENAHTPAYAAKQQAVTSTPFLDHGDVYQDDFQEQELAMGFSNTLARPPPPRPRPTSIRVGGMSGAPGRGRGRMSERDRVRQKGAVAASSASMFLFKKKEPPIPDGLENHIDALHGQPYPSFDEMEQQRREREELEKTPLQRLMDLGFEERASQFVLQVSNGDFDDALAMLTENAHSHQTLPIEDVAYAMEDHDDASNTDTAGEYASQQLLADALDGDENSDEAQEHSEDEEEEYHIPQQEKKKKSGIKKFFGMFK